MRFLVLFLAFVFTTIPAFADCSGPPGIAGTMDYFGAPDNSFKFCNGTSWVSMNAGTGVPSGAVMAFALTACPAGWSEYTQARGRFLRGLDNGAGNDPDGTRAPGSVQADAFQGHHHAYSGNYDMAPFDSSQPVRNTVSRRINTQVSSLSLDVHDVREALPDGTNGTPRTAGETRSKNVAVLFCYKS